ncbi:MAG: PAS domain-containing sensor histidine kinase [Gemmatimonadota bacterium]|nr:PAS domain-containing sensor histidine kinase [Gemmatimonadota bacterium]
MKPRDDDSHDAPTPSTQRKVERSGAPRGGGRDAAVLSPSGGSPSAFDGLGVYRLLVESVRDYAIFALDATGHILTWNRGAERLKGYSIDEIVGKHFSIFYPGEDKARGKPAWELEVAEAEGRFEDEGWRVRKDGSLFWANVIITALRNEQGILVGFGKVTRDLTDRRRAEEALRESELRFRLIVQSVRDYGIFMLDPAGYVASWNEGAERIHGYPAQEIVGQHFSVFYGPEDIAAGKPTWELEVAKTEGRFEDPGGWRVRKDGSLFWGNVVITALRDESGELFGFAKVTRDLTDRKAAQERVVEDARRIAEIQASSRAKSEFLASMSHELRTPLNAIGGYAELIEMGLGGSVSPQQREYLARIRGSQQHLLRIINDLLNYSRIEAGQVAYESAPVAMDAVIDTVVAMVLPQATTKRISLERGGPSDGVQALGDRVKIEQSLLNLVSNAVKFTPSDGRVRVSCEVDGDRICVRVKDTGPGIPEEKLAEIFEPFVQLGRSLSSGHEGVGLGLAISRDLARAMGGDVTVASTFGQGATFTLSLQRVKEPAAAAD